MVPPVALQLAKANKSKNFMASVHTIFCGAAPLGPDVERSVLQRTGISTFRQGELMLVWMLICDVSGGDAGDVWR